MTFVDRPIICSFIQSIQHRRSKLCGRFNHFDDQPARYIQKIRLSASVANKTNIQYVYFLLPRLKAVSMVDGRMTHGSELILYNATLNATGTRRYSPPTPHLQACINIINLCFTIKITCVP